MLFLRCLLIFALFGAWPAAAQQAKDPKQFAGELLDTLMSKGVDEAYKIVGEQTYLGRINKTAAIALKEATQKGITAYGTIRNYEFVREQRLGSTYRNYVFVVNHLQLGVVYTMTLYNAAQGWNLVRLDINDTAARMPWE